MKTLCVTAVVILLLTGVSALADDSAAVGRAKAATRSWLALADTGDDNSWDEASSLFKATVTKAAWANSLSEVRWTLGAMKSRKVRSAAFTRTLPGAPAGQYVVMQFDSRFEHRAAAVETVTSMLDKDGTWRVAGYFIK